ncbi:MAG: hypothetical protein DHS20C11_28520 [Lysobacteraceae bacterium]|nr:MAG: hypothetical protein DHS20C11_28520 [Xanthomonadaceae bacterium]
MKELAGAIVLLLVSGCASSPRAVLDGRGTVAYSKVNLPKLEDYDHFYVFEIQAAYGKALRVPDEVEGELERIVYPSEFWLKNGRYVVRHNCQMRGRRLAVMNVAIKRGYVYNMVCSSEGLVLHAEAANQSLNVTSAPLRVNTNAN